MTATESGGHDPSTCAECRKRGWRPFDLDAVMAEHGQVWDAALGEWVDAHPCGHATTVRGCGGCDPGAIESVITDDGIRRPFDPARDLAPLTTDNTPTTAQEATNA